MLYKERINEQIKPYEKVNEINDSGLCWYCQQQIFCPAF